MHKDIYRWIEEIRRYNPLLNLVSATMALNIEEHIENTMELLKHIKEPSIADFGSGSGLPAIPYKIMYPEAHVVMIERSEKKCVFLRHILDILNLGNVELIQADPLVTDIGPFDALMSRAFSPLGTLERLVMKTGKKGGRLYYLSTGKENSIKKKTLSLTGHEERRFRDYILCLDTYEITSR